MADPNGQHLAIGSGADCPLPQSADAERITLAYGEGGRLARAFVRERILTRFGNPVLAALGDAAVLSHGGRLAFSTDGFTVSPLFFPGGDIGRLAVCGTVNDLAVSGARPRWLSLALVVEEGLPWAVLDRVLDSAQAAAAASGVEIVTGDTKVVPRGAVDGLFITTSGIGILEEAADRPPPQPGDRIVVSGPIGRHGAAVICARDELGFDPAPVSDCASLAAPLEALRAAGLAPRAARDATRGGVAAVLHEWCAAWDCSADLDENRLPVDASVRAVCELLGLDPIFLACEGTFAAVWPAAQVDAALAILRRHPETAQSAVVGILAERRAEPVCVRRTAGILVPLDEPAGAPLPRIC